MHIRWRGLELPSAVVCDAAPLSSTYGKFVVEPFERGFGSTVGSGLRRILLSSLEGSAVTQIKVHSAQHEFTTIPGIVEDVTDVILNIKSLVVKNHSASAKTIRIDRHERGVVTGADIITDDQVEIINKDLVIATMTDDVPFLVELTVENGRGYQPVSEHYKADHEVGVIPVDAIYSPVVKVNFTVEPTRVQHATNFDRLILDVWTDGTISPEDAISQAAEILVNHFSLLGGAGTAGFLAPTEKPSANAVDIPSVIYNTPIEELDLSVRAYNCLKRSNITKVGQVLQMTEDELLAVRHFGRKSLDELVDRLALRSVPGIAADDMADEGEE